MCVELTLADAKYRGEYEEILPADGVAFLQLISDADERGEAVIVPKDLLKTDKIQGRRVSRGGEDYHPTHAHALHSLANAHMHTPLVSTNHNHSTP